MRIEIVKPRVWDVQIKTHEAVCRGCDGNQNFADNEIRFVAESGRVSGVPHHIKDLDSFRMMLQNRYWSPVRFITFRLKWLMTKGNDPEHLRHKIGKEMVGRSTRYLDASAELDGTEGGTYRIILPWHIVQILRKYRVPVREFEKVLNLELTHSQEAKFLKPLSDNEREILLNFAITMRTSIVAYHRMRELGFPRESARYVVPFCVAEAFYVEDVSLNYVINFIGQRSCCRASPEMQCLSAQLYFEVIKKLPILRGYLGCNGFRDGVCPESGVTGHRVPDARDKRSCPFAEPSSEVFIPTRAELLKGITNRFAKDNPKGVREKQLKIMEARMKLYADWGVW